MNYSRAGSVDDIMVQFDGAKIALAHEFEERRKLQMLKSMVMVSLLKIVILAQYFVLPCLHFYSRMLQNK